MTSPMPQQTVHSSYAQPATRLAAFALILAASLFAAPLRAQTAKATPEIPIAPALTTISLWRIPTRRWLRPMAARICDPRD